MVDLGIYERLRLIAVRFYGNESKMVSELGFKQSTYATAKSRNSEVSLDLIRRILNSGNNINADWLIKGEGEMLKKDFVQEAIMIEEFDDDKVEVLTNSNGNKFFIYPNNRILIEVPKIPFSAHASYLECYQDEACLAEEFDTITFAVDHIGRGNYMAFTVSGDSMNGGGIDDTTDGAQVLAREIGRHLWNDLHRTKLGVILVTKTGIFHKDIQEYNPETGMLLLTSRNKMHKAFEYPINDVNQIFNVIKRLM